VSGITVNENVGVRAAKGGLMVVGDGEDEWAGK